MNSSRLIRFLSLNSDFLAKKQEEVGNTVSFLQKVDSKTWSFEKKGEYVKRRKEKKAEKG